MSINWPRGVGLVAEYRKEAVQLAGFVEELGGSSFDQ